jgi:hypothetical protein
MASGGKTTHVAAHLVGDFLYRPAWNQLDDLVERGIYSPCYLFIAPCRVTRGHPNSNIFHFLWDASDLNSVFFEN